MDISSIHQLKRTTPSSSLSINTELMHLAEQGSSCHPFICMYTQKNLPLFSWMSTKLLRLHPIMCFCRCWELQSVRRVETSSITAAPCYQVHTLFHILDAKCAIQWSCLHKALHIKCKEKASCHRGPDVWLFHGVKRQVWLYIILYKLWKMSPSNLLSYKIHWVYKCIITMNRISKAVKTCFVIITQIPNLNKILNCKSVYLNTQIPSTFLTCYFLLWADM